MAITDLPKPSQIHRFPQAKYVDYIRWLTSVSPFQKFTIIAFFDTDTDTPSLEIHSLDPTSKALTPLSQWTPPSRISSLKSTPSLIAASTYFGSLHIFPTATASEMPVLEPKISVDGKDFHVGCVTSVDWMEGGSECVTVGQDGRVNLVKVFGAEGRSGNAGFRRVFDGNGLVSYSAVRWASPNEFVTGGYGFGLQWWDARRPGSSVAQFKGDWDNGKTSGIIHSIDIHPSRKHTCLAGGSLGTVFAWDLRSPQQPIILSGFGMNEARTHSLTESEVWEVQYDNYTNPSRSSISSLQILPAMFCSEDGILAVIEQVEEPAELLAEPCAVNSFDIDHQNPSDVICGLEWESIAILLRS